MHADRPVGDWWTMERLIIMLEEYPTLCEAMDKLRAQPFPPPESHVQLRGTAVFCHAAEVKADLDNAIAQLRPYSRQTVLMRYRDCYSEPELAARRHTTEEAIYQQLGRARGTILKILRGQPVSKQATSGVSISK